MSGIMKVFVLLAVLVCIAKAQMDQSGSRCLCSDMKQGLDRRYKLKEIHIYQESNFCSNVEIVATMSNDSKRCLDPKKESVQRLIASIMTRKARASTRRVSTSTPDSITTESP